MKKVIIVEEENHSKASKPIISKPFSNWLLYMVGYAIVLITVSCLFHKSFYIDSSYFGLYAFVAAIIIYILNQTIKPILFYLTLPITALSFGLFYPILNVFVLKITSFLLGEHFQLPGIILPIVVAVLISILNLFMEGMVIKPIVRRRKGD